MQSEIKKEIKLICNRILNKQRLSAETAMKYQEKYQRRTGNTPGIPRKQKFAYVHAQFDPIHCKRNANGLAKAIWNKVLNFAYNPIPAIIYEIPKDDGSKREITSFSIADTAVANVVFRRTRRRNKKRASPNSFAYDEDKNLFDAVLSIRSALKSDRVFTVQYDFRKYFDYIPSSYLKKLMDDRDIAVLTPHEKHIYSAFLHHKYSPHKTYELQNHATKHRGTPQGSSTSLFLANLANNNLDILLTERSGTFARYADDVVAICSNYEQSQRIEEAFFEHCKESGLKINNEKSPGINLLSSEPQELRSFRDFKFLGYKFTNDGLDLPSSAQSRLITKISNLINTYLFTSTRHGLGRNRVSTSLKYDWDLLGLIYEIRRSLYGGLTEDKISGFLKGTRKISSMRGLMGFYALIENPKTLRSLDGWLVNAIRRACVARNHELSRKYKRGCLTPNNSQLISGDWLSKSAWRSEGKLGNLPESELPSFVRGWRAARKYYFTFGLENVAAPGYQSSADILKLFSSPSTMVDF